MNLTQPIRLPTFYIFLLLITSQHITLAYTCNQIWCELTVLQCFALQHTTHFMCIKYLNTNILILIMYLHTTKGSHKLMQCNISSLHHNLLSVVIWNDIQVRYKNNGARCTRQHHIYLVDACHQCTNCLVLKMGSDLRANLNKQQRKRISI